MSNRSSPGRFGRFRADAGLTLAETLVAATLLIIGSLGTFALVDTANSTTSQARAREGATNLGREVLEDARSTAYANVGPPGWLQPKLQSLSGGTGTVTSPSTYSQQTTVTRRGIAYTVVVTPCSVDDSRDSYGAHGAGINWCTDSGSSGTTDGQPEDMKRVAVTISWTVNGRVQSPLTLTGTFGSSGAAIGPATSALAIVAPTGLTGSPPVVATNPAGGIVKFRGTSVGAADMKFTVNGGEQQTGIVNNNNTTWDFSWNISALKDGTYTIGAVAIDALGTRGQPLTIQITLNRTVPGPLANLTGGYNYVKVAGTRTLVLEGAWDANAEGNVTGYEVDRGATVVCGGATSLATECIDLNPPASGSATYTTKTWYRDAAGNQQFIATSYVVTAPISSVTNVYGMVNSSNNPTGSCYSLGTRKDLSSTFPTSGGTDSTLTTTGGNWMIGCMPAFPAGTSLNAGTGTIQAWYTNSGNKTCAADWGLFLNGTTLLAGTSFFSGGTAAKYNIVSSATPTKVTLNFSTTAHTFSTGDVLSLALQGDTASGTCANHTLYYGSGAHQTTLTLPLTSTATNLPQPAAPTGLSLVHNGDGTNTLTWNAASGTPAPDFYRIYRDGQNYTNRVDTVGDGGTATLTWTDTNTGGATHTYYVTTAAATLAESNSMAGPVSG
ncbi:MAG: hypothetical protein QOG41_1425 [Thermoleophilaceae bacterium]|nr:hypothetical protein [Thermoleophilaceae bacterium]